jgi:hypothetical protein
MMGVARLCCEASQLLTASEKKELIKRLPFKESTFSKFVQIGKDARLRGSTPDDCSRRTTQSPTR